jgi:hypothetical protein
VRLEDARPLLGKRVSVTLTEPDAPEGLEVCQGTLLSFADSGEAVLVDRMGFVHYCWPMLDVEEIT